MHSPVWLSKALVSRFQRVAWGDSVFFVAATAFILTALAIALRLTAQQGIPLYPDSYQSMLLVRALSESIPADAAMGTDGSIWAVPFYRLGYPLTAWPLSFFSNDPFLPGLLLSLAAGTAAVPLVYFLVSEGLRSRVAAAGAGLAMAISFSAVAWSRFAMSEALAVCMIALTLLLCVLAGGRSSRWLSILAGVSGAFMVLVRLELLVLLPTCVLFILVRADPGGDGRTSRLRHFLAAWIASFVALSILAAWLAQNVAEAFSLNPLFLLRNSFLKANGTDAASPGLVSGVASFAAYEPVLILGSIIGLAVGLRARDRRLWPIWPGLALLLAVEVPRNDVRFLVTTVPLLAYTAGLGFEAVWKWAARLLQVASPARALILSGAFGMAAVVLFAGQLLQTEARWHPERGYENEIAQGLEMELTRLNLGGAPVVCAYSPEAHYLVGGLPARRLSEPDLSQCTAPGAKPRPVLVVVDEALRQHLGENFERQVQSAGSELFRITTDAPYLKGASVYDDTDPAIVYLLQETAGQPGE